jgi:hypothetical protein
MNKEQVWREHRECVDSAITRIAATAYLSRVEQQGLTDFVMTHVAENDYALLRQFANRSSFATFVHTMIQRLVLDFRTQLWNHWRPTVLAARRGHVAVLLERLIDRDGHSIVEAIEIARTDHGVDRSVEELTQLWTMMERHKPPRTD